MNNEIIENEKRQDRLINNFKIDIISKKYSKLKNFLENELESYTWDDGSWICVYCKEYNEESENLILHSDKCPFLEIKEFIGRK